MDILHTMAPGDPGILALGLVLAGIVGGLASGVFGIGGGIVVMPVLYHVLATLRLDPGIRMHVAIGTTLAAMLPAALARMHGLPGDAIPLRIWSVIVAGGVAAGSALLAVLTGPVLAVIFAVTATLVLLLWLLPAKRHLRLLPNSRIAGAFVAAGTGMLGALSGIGGRNIGAPLLAFSGMPIRQALAIASVFGAIVGVLASAGAVLAGWHARALPPLSLGYVNLLGFALLAPVLLLLESAGTWIAEVADLKRLRLVLATFVVIATLRMLWDAFA